MRQTELHRTDEDRELIESYRSKGLHRVREVKRAHSLSALDRQVPEARIMAVLGVGRSAIWRTRSAYLEGGAEDTLHDLARPGKPRQYDTDVEARISALACSEPPAGAKRWTPGLLEQTARAQGDIGPISREISMPARFRPMSRSSVWMRRVNNCSNSHVLPCRSSLECP